MTLRPAWRKQFPAWGKRIALKLKKALVGIDDVLVVGDTFGRVGLWGCTGKVYERNDRVPHLPNGHSTYSIRSREGDFFNVGKGKLMSVTAKPIMGTVVDADGDRWRP